MSEKTGISWTDATFNPWWGCVKVSPGCDNCYAERDSARFMPGKTLWGLGATYRTFGDKHWNEPRRWAKTLPAKLGRRPRVFCASMADVFDKHAPESERERLWTLIEETPELDWLLLTKRIGNVARMVPDRWCALMTNGARRPVLPDNIWLGISVVNQEEADRDIPKLLELKAWVRWLSIEPMLGPVDLAFGASSALTGAPHFSRGVDWVVVGGESGPLARPMHPEWAVAIQAQCAAAGVPFFFKQWGEWAPLEVCANPEAPWTPCGVDRTHLFGSRETGDAECVFRIGRKAAGDKLYAPSRIQAEGRQYQEFPQ